MSSINPGGLISTVGTISNIVDGYLSTVDTINTVATVSTVTAVDYIRDGYLSTINTIETVAIVSDVDYIRDGYLSTVDTINTVKTVTTVSDVDYIRDGYLSTVGTVNTIKTVSTITAVNNIIDGNVGVYFKDSPNLDAFGRLRTSAPFTIFDSKQLSPDVNLYWDQALSTTGASSSFSLANASTTISVNASDGYAIRQTKMRFNYQPAKSNSVVLTAANFQGQNQVTKRLGYFAGILGNGNSFSPTDGLFFSSDGYVGSEVIAVNMAKNGFITSVPQSSWNIDKMNGTGTSGYTIDFSKTQIYWIDFEWLGVGRVRFGLVVDGQLFYVHALMPII